MEINQESTDLFFCEAAMMMTSKAPLQRLDVCIVATKNYVFAVPMKSVGMYFVLTTIKTHNLFQDVNIPEGVKRLITNSSSVEDLENSIKNLLENNDLYIYPVAGNSSFKFRGFLGKHTLRIGIDKMRWTSFSPTKGAASKLFRKFYGQ